MKTFIDALTWAIAAASALAIIGTSASAAKDLTLLKALRARPSALRPRAPDRSGRVPKAACQQQGRG